MVVAVAVAVVAVVVVVLCLCAFGSYLEIEVASFRGQGLGHSGFRVPFQRAPSKGVFMRVPIRIVEGLK